MIGRAAELACAILATGCASTPKINYDADPQADFGGYRTYSSAVLANFTPPPASAR
jgi:hypothetical protein